MMKFLKRIRRSAAAASLAATVGATVGVTLGGAAVPALAASLSGSYLAARHAAAQTDVDAAARYFASALRRDPNDLRLLEQTLIYLTAAGRASEAVDAAKRLESSQPAHRMAALLITAAAIREGELEEAASRLSGAPTAYHPLVKALLSAWIAHGLGEDVEPAFAELDDRAIFRIFKGYHTGLMRHSAGRYDEAVTAFETATEEMATPTGRMARAYGAALRDAGRKDDAIRVYESAMGAAVSDAALEAEIAAADAGEPAGALAETTAEGAAEALYGLAAALGGDGEDRLSLFYARIASYLRPRFDDATLLSAELLEAEDQFDLAIDAYEAIPASSPLSRTAEIGRAEALRSLGEIDQAAEALKALTRRAPKAIDAHIALGDLMRRNERYREGAEAYDDAVALMEATERLNWVLYYQRGITFERSDQWPKAEADFFRALDLMPDQPLILNYLGYSWLEKGVNIERALEMIRKAVEQRPDDGYIVDSLGWGYYLQEDFTEAVGELERAVELRPVDPVINDHFGDALWRVGRKREAEFQWRRALSFDPEEENATRIRRKLDIGLDAVLSDEAAADAIREAATANDG